MQLSAYSFAIVVDRRIEFLEERIAVLHLRKWIFQKQWSIPIRAIFYSIVYWKKPKYPEKIPVFSVENFLLQHLKKEDFAAKSQLRRSLVGIFSTGLCT